MIVVPGGHATSSGSPIVLNRSLSFEPDREPTLVEREIARLMTMAAATLTARRGVSEVDLSRRPDFARDAQVFELRVTYQGKVLKVDQPVSNRELERFIGQAAYLAQDIIGKLVGLASQYLDIQEAHEQALAMHQVWLVECEYQSQMAYVRSALGMGD